MKCSNCQEMKAEYYCLNCLEPICGDCANDGCECSKAPYDKIPKNITTKKQLKSYLKGTTDE